jgi:hypothetical protein
MENLTSTPFSMRDSGSAFINQYDRSLSSSATFDSSDSECIGCDGVSVPFCTGVFLGLPTGRFGPWGVWGAELGA